MLIRFYEKASGREPVKDYLRSLTVRDRAIAAKVIDSIRMNGIQASGVTFRHIRGKVWEFYVIGDTAHRIFYVTISGPTMVLLHAYKKESQKAPISEIEIAETRAGEILNKK